MELSIDNVVDIVSIIMAIGISVFAFGVVNKLRGGTYSRPWRFMAASPLVFAFGEASHILSEAGMLGNGSEIVHAIFEALFLVILLYAFFLANRFWHPKTKRT